MTQAFAAAESIRATPEQIWHALTDWANGPRWLPGVTSMTGPNEPRLGDTVLFVARGVERSSTITALESSRLLTLTSTQGPVTAHYTYTLAGEHSGTSVLLTADVLIRGALRVLAPVIRSSIAKEDGNQLELLKVFVEALPNVSPT